MQNLTERFIEGVQLMLRLHKNQRRKGNDVPYASHLLRVAGLTLEFGADEDTVIAALLHDAVEDQGGLMTAALIRKQFGMRVERFVLGCSDSFSGADQPKRPWRERKEAAIAMVDEVDPEIQLIIACDKLDNLRSTILEYPKNGPQLWERFSGGRDGTLWYYRSMIDALKEAGGCPLIDELEAAYQRLITLVANRENLP